jgi:hypothetical protein
MNYIDEIAELKQNVNMLFSTIKVLEQKMEDNEIVNPIYKNGVDLEINCDFSVIDGCGIPAPPSGLHQVIDVYFYKNNKNFHWISTKEFVPIYNHRKNLEYSNLQTEFEKILQINFNKITINITYNNTATLSNNVGKYNYDTFLVKNERNKISKFLQTYAVVNKHVINQIIITGNEIGCDIIETLSKLTNYKELHINDSQLEYPCKNK